MLILVDTEIMSISPIVSSVTNFEAVLFLLCLLFVHSAHLMQVLIGDLIRRKIH